MAEQTKILIEQVRGTEELPFPMRHTQDGGLGADSAEAFAVACRVLTSVNASHHHPSHYVTSATIIPVSYDDDIGVPDMATYGVPHLVRFETPAERWFVLVCMACERDDGECCHVFYWFTHKPVVSA
jgi:hypothetical protein